MKNNYLTKIKNLEEITKRVDENNKVRGAFPNLLNQLMNTIPTYGAKLTGIENTNVTHIKLTVQAAEYEQIAYFIGAIRTDNILTNVISSSGERVDDFVTVTIEGELP